jgi:hypothetical protein
MQNVQVADKKEPASDQEEKKAVSKQEPKKAEVLCFGGVSKKGSLQGGFERFRKSKRDDLKYRQYV